MSAGGSVIVRRWLFVCLGCLLVILIVSLGALAAGMNIDESGMQDQTFSTDYTNFIPPECSSITIEALVNLAAGDSPSNQNDLILGTSTAETINGGNGDDCILGGGGNDTLRGGNGNDVLLGHGGDDDLIGGPATDVCYGGDGTDTMNCETENQ